ncbi:MAG: heme-binding domain-containing protein [Deltaproteobacteria bacterium]|nr:heme-binding domain-containing protein [Deltaproteobacteria bacterium]
MKIKYLLGMRLLFLMVLFFVFSYAHKGLKPPILKDKTSETTSRTLAYQAINQQYVQNIKQIFQKVCFDCHSNKTNYPWYHKLPGLKQFIERDIREGKKHLNLSNDFPFKSHATPQEDLDAIEKVILDNSMPPWRYKILHWNSKLTEAEKKEILKWIHSSLSAILKICAAM